MTENIYTGFGSHFVLEPHQHISLDDTTTNIDSSVGKWRHLKLQLKYFTIQAKDNPKEHVTSVDSFNTNNERLIVTDTLSCESFHSCYSTISSHDPSKPSQEYDTNYRNQNSRSKLSNDEFNDQITMINAIFLSKKYPEDKRFALKKEMKTTEDFSSGDTTLEHVSPDHKYSPLLQNKTENLRMLKNRNEEHQEYSVTASNENSHVKTGTVNRMFKTFKTNRKATDRTKKPLIPKIRRIGHEQLPQKIQSLKMQETKCRTLHFSGGKGTQFVEGKDEFHKGVLLQVKHGLNEGYEMHFLEPIPITTHSIKLCNSSENVNGNSDVNTICTDKENHSHSQDCKVVDGSEKSSSIICKNPKNSDSNILVSENLKDSKRIVDFCNTNYKFKSTEPVCQSGSLQKEVYKDLKSAYGQGTEPENPTEVHESQKIQLADVLIPLDTNSEILLKNLGWTRKKDYKCAITLEKFLGHTKTENNKNGYKPTEESETEHLSNTLNGKNSTISLNPTRRSYSRKSALPVIEESPEPMEIDVPADYCLIDTIGRPIHLFDFKGFPLTDSSGRPLRNAAGELLLKCADNGIPIVDEKTHIFDVFGRQPHEEGFQPWKSPINSGASRLTSADGCPLILFDIEGRPLTSISGTMLVDKNGRSLLKLRNCFFQTTLNM